MKRIKFLGLLALSGMFLIPLVNVQAAQYHDPIDLDEIVESSFSGLEESELVLEMPEGGFLHGQATEYSTSDLNTVIAEYDSETDPNSVTVAEAREILKADAIEAETSIQPYGAVPPSNNTLRKLKYGDKYDSKIFTGNGWRFSDVQWKAESGGDYLKWWSTVDSGMVGSYGEAYATYSGSIQGTLINLNTYVWNSENGQGQVYYTVNPIPGTQYHILNAD